MTDAEMRLVISQAYKSQKWLDKVAAMPNSQVIAVYYSIMNQKKEKQ